jgi:hypothetical protein
VRWGGLLAAVGIIERAVLASTYAPVSYGDSPSYMRLAEVLARSWLKGYDGTRVPGYPAFLALLGLKPVAVWGTQMAIGVAISLLLFYVVLRSTQSAPWAFAAGVLYDVIAAQVLFEANLLSETLTTLFLVGSLALFLTITPQRGLRRLLLFSAALGLAASLAGMVRTLFYFLPVFLMPFVWLAAGGDWRRRLGAVAALSLPAVLILGGWIAWIHNHYGMLSPSTMSGYNLVQHTGSYFDDLPDSEAAIRDTYIKYRDQRLADRGVQTNAIWDAIPELTEKTGLSFFALSQKMETLSLQLILTHPLHYGRDVVTGWIAFWKAPVYWDPGSVHPAGLKSMYVAWGWLGRGISLMANAAFLVISLLVAASARLRRRWGIDRFLVLMAGTVWVSSIVQTLVDHGDNPRFLVPLQMFVVITVLIAIRGELIARRTQTRGS